VSGLCVLLAVTFAIYARLAAAAAAQSPTVSSSSSSPS
jgi:hypothetical protein